MLHYTNDKTRNQLLTFFNNLYTNKSFPAKWKKALQVAIPKIGKKDQFRPISWLNYISKVYESMILNRSRNKIKHKLNKKLFGYNQNTGTRDALITLTEKITKPRFSTNTRPSIVVFIDFEKAFELANPTIITDEARRLGIKGNLLAFIHNSLNNRSGAVKFQNSISNFYPFENGTPQGSVISPFLFNLLINRLLFNNSKYIPKISKTVTIASYADDLVIIGYSQSVIQKALNSIASKANKIGLKINISKTDFMLIFRKTKPSLVNKNIILKLNDQKLNQVYHKKYLGVIFDTHLKFNHHLNHITKKANNKINILRKLSGVKWGIDSETALTFVKASIIPTLEYGIEIIPKSRIPIFKKINSIIAKAIKIALNIPFRINNQITFLEANIPLTEYRMQRAAIMYLNQVVLEGPSHPLFPDFTNTATCLNPIISNKKNNQPKNTRWSSSIKQLIAKYNPGTATPIVPLDLPPWTNPLKDAIFQTDLINKPKNTLTNEEKKEIKHNIENNIINPNIANPKHLNIFTDGSVDQQNKKAGAAAIFVSQSINNSNQMQVAEFLKIISKNPDSIIEDDSLNNTLNELYQDFQYQCPLRLWLHGYRTNSHQKSAWKR